MLFDQLEVMEAGDRWMQQRAQFRAENQRRVREREGLPLHDGEKYVVGSKRVGLAVGVQKGKDFESAARDTGFDHVLSDPHHLDRELSDLVRDAQALALAEGVRHVGEESLMIPDAVLADDDRLDNWMQGELMRRRKL